MEALPAVRRFNRTYTQRIGLLDDSYLSSGRSLGANRLLFEIGFDGAGVKALRRRLGLDSGYVSRLLRRLEADGLVRVSADPADRRHRVVALTAAGRREWTRLDQRSDRAAASLLAPLAPRQQAELADCLGRAERLVQAATATFERVSPAAPEAEQALAAYFAELDERFPTGFDPGSAGGVDVAALSPPDGAFLVVTVDGEAVGCGGVQRIDRTTGEVKRMWIDRRWRGLRLGHRLLERLEDEARALRFRRLVLDTNGTLLEAIAMYERAGYEPTERYNDNPYAERWFAKPLGHMPFASASVTPA